MTETPLFALVPVRAGSKGLPGKNVAMLADKPLYRHAIDQGLATGAHVLLSTDIDALLDIDHGPGVTLIARPPALCADDTPMDAVIAHALCVHSGPGRIVLLQATSPLRVPADILAAVALHKRGSFDLVMSVSPAPSVVLKWGRVVDGVFMPIQKAEYCFMNRQALPPLHRPNGAVYVFDADWFRTTGRLATDQIGAVEMPQARALDIDNLEDLSHAARILAQSEN